MISVYVYIYVYTHTYIYKYTLINKPATVLRNYSARARKVGEPKKLWLVASCFGPEAMDEQSLVCNIYIYIYIYMYIYIHKKHM